MTRVSFPSAATVLLAAVFGGVSAAAAMESPRNHCVDLKNKSAAKAFECVARDENKIIEGGTADLVKCYAALSSAFTKAEASGACPTTGDESSVQQRVTDAENAILTTLQASQATTPAAERCIAMENRAAANLGQCTAKLFSKELAGQKGACCFDSCPLAFITAFNRGTGCMPTQDMFAAVETDSIPPGTNLGGADLSNRELVGLFPGMNLHDADLTSAVFDDVRATAVDFTGADLTLANLAAASIADSDMSGATLNQTFLRFTDLTGVDLSGATVSAVGWSGTICPDGTESDTNGSSPESCCAHLNGAVPASCSP